MHAEDTEDRNPLKRLEYFQLLGGAILEGRMFHFHLDVICWY